MLAPGSERRYDAFDLLPGGLDGQPEPLALGEQVVDAGRAAVGADAHREVAALEAHHGHGYEVVRQRQAPAARGAAHGVIPRMVVVVGDCRAEDDAPEQLDAIFVGLLGPAAQLVGEQRIGPALPVEMVLVAIEQRKPAHEPEAEIAAVGVRAIETLHHQLIASTDGLDARVARSDAAAAGRLDGRVFDPLQAAAVGFFRKLPDPQAISVLDGGLWPRAAHRGAGLELLQDVDRHAPSLFDRLSSLD